jgi:hypothetical protein
MIARDAAQVMAFKHANRCPGTACDAGLAETMLSGTSSPFAPAVPTGWLTCSGRPPPTLRKDVDERRLCRSLGRRTSLGRAHSAPCPLK